MSGGMALVGGKAVPAQTGLGGSKKGRIALIVGAAVALIAIGAALWFSGVLPGGKRHAAAALSPTYLDLPDIITNLNVASRRQSYLKLQAKLELGGPADVAPATAAIPRIIDLFQTYLRDMRPEELRGSEGSYRLREELLDRAAIAAAPAQIRGVLFLEMVIQ